jgi:Peptidase A4 family
MSKGSRRARALLAAVGSAVAAVALVAAAPGSSAVAPHATESDSAGYVAEGATYTSVSASWTLAAVTCPGTQTVYTSNWVGLDGFDNSALEMTGSETDCVNGQPEYGVWWEVLPAAESVYTGVTPRAGDHLTASVSYVGNSNFTMTVSDTTQGWTKSTTHRGSTGFENDSAEVISQNGNGLGGILPGTVSFTNCTVDGAPLGNADPEQEDATYGTVSSLSNGENFSVKWAIGGGGVTPFPGRAS